MIYSLRGKILLTDTSGFVIECGGVGYRCTAPLGTLSSLPAKGNEAFVFTYMNVREDAVDLFGFASEDELSCFKLITSVSGVGPKIGIAILSEFKPEQVYLYIASSDHKMLTRANGVGAKLAQRIVLELKDKVGSGMISGDNNVSHVGNAMSYTNTSEAVSALVSLGYSQSEAAMAVGKLDPTLSVEQLIKDGLLYLSGMVK